MITSFTEVGLKYNRQTILICMQELVSLTPVIFFPAVAIFLNDIWRQDAISWHGDTERAATKWRETQKVL